MNNYVEITVYILDISYEVVGSEPHIIIWGIDEEGRRIILRDKRFKPYFYVILDNEHLVDDKIEILRKYIQSLSQPKSPIISVDHVKKKFLGKPVDVLKIVTSIPEYVREYRKDLAKIPGVKDVIEADIRFSMRYLIDNDIYPCTWHKFKVVERGLSFGFRVQAEYEIVEVLNRVEKLELPKLRILAFDIEVYNPHGAPRPDRDPVIVISLMNSEKEVLHLVARDKDDRILLKEFVNYIQKYDPDIIVGYNSNNFDWPYLIDRARRLGLKLDISRRVGIEPTKSVHGHVSIPGRINIDLYDLAEELTEIKVKSLDEVADYLGVMKKNERVNVAWYEIYKYWDDIEKRRILLAYARDDVVSTYGIAEKFLPFIIQLSSITGIPPDQVSAASVGFRLEWYLMRIAYRIDELIPNRVEHPYEPYRGAIVLEPKKGVHEDIAVIDFSSMYPSIMIRYNIGPDTYVSNEFLCEISGCYEAVEVGYKFLKQPNSFFKIALENLIKTRKEVRDQMKKYSIDSYEYRLLDAKQRALKVLANACYGYMGWTGARWYCRECAEAVAAFGRELIKKTMEIARKLGLEMIYGDTDSIFVKHDAEKVKRFIEEIEKNLGFEIKVDKIYQRIFFTEAKKRYVGLTSENYIDIVGFEAVRGDWAEIARDIQEKVAEIVLKTMDHRKAVEYVRKELETLRKKIITGEAPIDKFIIWKTITRPLLEYEATQPHVLAAKELVKMGYKIEIGDKIGYIICRGSGKISERARPYMVVDVKDIDFEYYVEHQIIPAVIRILGYFGVTETQIKSVAKGGKSLLDYTKDRSK
ncbi:MAG: DNA polymerase II [Ignisphaera sp.]